MPPEASAIVRKTMATEPFVVTVNSPKNNACRPNPTKKTLYSGWTEKAIFTNTF